MINDVTRKNNKINRFWDITSEWWFFPSLHLILALIATIIRYRLYGVQYFMKSLFEIIVGLPFGFLNFPLIISFIGNKDILNDIFGLVTWIFYPFQISSWIVIYYFKYNKNRILKWVILLLLMLYIFAFIGCVAVSPY